MAAINVFFVGGELEAFVAGSHASTTWATDAGTYDSNFSRGAVKLSGATVGYIRAPLTAAQATSYHTFQGYRNSLGGSGVTPSNGTWMQFLDEAFTPIFRLQGIGGTDAQPILAWQYWNGSAWVTIGSMVVTTSARHRFDFALVISDTVGVARAYADGVQFGSGLTGDTKFTASGKVLEARHYETSAGLSNSTIYLSEYQVLDVSTLGRRLATLGQTANSAVGNTAWTGVYTDANETGTYSDATFLESGTAAQYETAVTTDLSATAQAYLVDGLIIAGRALKGAVGPQNLYGATVIGGVTYDSPAVVAGPSGGLVTDFGYVWAHFPENPATTADFTAAEINTAGFETGWKSAA